MPIEEQTTAAPQRNEILRTTKQVAAIIRTTVVRLQSAAPDPAKQPAASIIYAYNVLAEVFDAYELPSDEGS
jgi:hypothetical protein